MARSVAKLLRWLVAVDAAAALFILAFGFLLTFAKTPMQGHPLMATLFGMHGILFGLVLPILIYSLVPLALTWIIAALVGRQSKA
ncbi:MAG TPA: hypothetical protein VFP96_01980 [Candidatus Acidoferrum sp.]|jgi:hypothetical protein|nr:hypothetical protein [Candidatus Acidoferrum sp.]